MKICNHWSPVEITQDDITSVSVLGRTYKTGKDTVFFSSIVSCDKELLASSMKLHAFENGKECEFCEAKTFVLDSNDEEKKSFVSVFESESAVVNVTHCIEFDGCDDITLTVVPRGLSVAQVFGLAPIKYDLFGIDKLYLDIPLSKEHFHYYHVYPSNNIVAYQPEEKKRSINYAGNIPVGGFHCRFKEQIYLNGDDVGIGFFFSDDKNRCLSDQDYAIEVIEQDEQYLLRIHFFNIMTPRWSDRGENNTNTMHLFPVSFRFGMQVTPVKTFPREAFYERNVRIDCFKKLPTELSYDVFLENPVENSDEIGYDRMKRLGVKVLYLHEKWNDIQNSPILTQDSANRLKKIVTECHKRDIKVIPYFGYELSTMSPIWSKYGEKLIMKQRETWGGSWYRYPYQRDFNVCFGSEWADIFYDGIIKLHQEFGFDGFYFDSLVASSPCVNQAHGCGYRDKNGNLHPTYRVWEIRDFMKKLYRYTTEHGLIINVHPTGCFNLAALAFCDSLFDGETFQGMLLRGEIHEIPEDVMKAQFVGTNSGLPISCICYTNEKWKFRNAVATTLLYGAFTQPLELGESLETMSKIWDALDSFDFSDYEWYPYYKNGTDLVSDNEGVKVSYYKNKDTILAFASSISTEFQGKVTFRSSYKTILNIMDGNVLSDNGVFSADYNGMDFIAFLAKNN